MQSSKLALIHLRARLAAVVFALVCTLATAAAVFTSASAEVDPPVSRTKSAPAAGPVANEAASGRVRG
jgi:hypothetical protein